MCTTENGGNKVVRDYMKMADPQGGQLCTVCQIIVKCKSCRDDGEIVCVHLAHKQPGNSDIYTFLESTALFGGDTVNLDQEMNGIRRCEDEVCWSEELIESALENPTPLTKPSREPKYILTSLDPSGGSNKSSKVAMVSAIHDDSGNMVIVAMHDEYCSRLQGGVIAAAKSLVTEHIRAVRTRYPQVPIITAFESNLEIGCELAMSVIDHHPMCGPGFAKVYHIRQPDMERASKGPTSKDENGRPVRFGFRTMAGTKKQMIMTMTERLMSRQLYFATNMTCRMDNLAERKRKYMGEEDEFNEDEAPRKRARREEPISEKIVETKRQFRNMKRELTENGDGGVRERFSAKNGGEDVDDLLMAILINSLVGKQLWLRWRKDPDPGELFTAKRLFFPYTTKL